MQKQIIMELNADYNRIKKLKIICFPNNQKSTSIFPLKAQRSVNTIHLVIKNFLWSHAMLWNKQISSR